MVLYHTEQPYKAVRHTMHCTLDRRIHWVFIVVYVGGKHAVCPRSRGKYALHGPRPGDSALR